MPLLTCEFDRDGSVREWHATADGITMRTVEAYHPTVFVAGPERVRDRIETRLTTDPKVAATGTDYWHLALGDRDRSAVLRIDCERVDEVETLADEIRGEHSPPGTLRFYNVDLAPQFRYCIETGTRPVPARELTVLELALPGPCLVDDVTALTVDGESLADTPREALRRLDIAVTAHDPDVLLCSTAALIPLCHQQAEAVGVDDFRLGRAPGYERLAGQSTYESYGQVGHSPARYRVPGRAVIDRSNSFLLDEAGLPGLCDLVERSWRPLQETAWGSIGTILTAIQVREALNRGVLIPWNKWEPEQFKRIETLHAADRGGFTFAPEVGRHDDIVELDFGSLYPNIMCEYNISPETICCDCCPGEDVPGLGYSICDREGFIPDVLTPIIDDRAAIKDEIRRTDDPAQETRLQARSDALKWILVSCFGYQGYRNAKFGRIECHEAINAVARELLLDTKDRLEAGGWRVVHGIVDSLWVQPVTGEGQRPLSDITTAVGAAVGIPLEIEDRFEWVCFVPRRNGGAGTLTKYFGKVAGREEYKLRGIEARQRSTPPFIANLQRALIETLDRKQDPAPVCDRLHRGLDRIERGDVPPEELCITKRVSQPRSEYEQRTATVAALDRAATLELPRHPGQDVEYLVVDDSRRGEERVRLSVEDLDHYDATFYAERALRAGESVLSPLGWDRQQIQRYWSGHDTLTLAAFQ
ncbi:MAG: type B DNA-directed DNA polymerase [Halovenus sp.]